MKKVAVESSGTIDPKWLAFVIIIAGASFLLGSSYSPKAAESEPEAPPVENNSVITDIQQSLQSPEANVATANATEPVAQNQPGLININTATSAQLETLPGIGPSKAQAIISYRQQNGQFIRIEDIQSVKGIGPKTFEDLKSKITI